MQLLYSGKSIYECPKCHQFSGNIDDSRDNNNMNSRIRRRVCKYCGFKWHTAEICVEDAEELEARRIGDPENLYKKLTKYSECVSYGKTRVLNKLVNLEQALGDALNDISKLEKRVFDGSNKEP